MNAIDREENIADDAHGFLIKHGSTTLPNDIDGLTERCAAHLIQTHALSYREAVAIARRELGEITAHGVDAYIEHDLSTSRMLVVTDTASGKQHMVTIGELLMLVRFRDSTTQLYRRFDNAARLSTEPPG